MARKSNTAPALPAGTESAALVTDPMAALFTAPENVPDSSSMVVKSMAPLIKPRDFPTGQKLIGYFVRIIQTGEFAPEKKGGKPRVGTSFEVSVRRPGVPPMNVAIPATALLRNALEITGDGDEATSPNLGHLICIEKLPNKLPSKKGNDAWNFLVGVYPDEILPEFAAKKGGK